ncbi:hypothetical protein FZO89_00925 [Luteimonas viscosa]|uniref:Permuted papain-like amidase enzyme, YaeF/YiiX, C92 family n=1 Tax=Luteimonas viscosa TaxID=1132694 RepID=A0A5D4XJX8_9GAMM|nr:YiiX/YebB-like N1pC/P60 family cysteine hydrolase [Luteimonas viscosa]TYT24956.1 hypothetical protein FZO89_00925 [Luteimonas viscosa]
MKQGDANGTYDPDVARWVIDHEALRPGDIIATRTPGSFVSGAIKTATRGEFSHVIICTRPPICVESAEFGVVKISLRRFLINDIANVRVLRHCDADNLRDDLESAASYAESKVEREYADIDVLTAVLSMVPSVEHGKFFCSQLVAAAYASAGLPIIQGRPPEKTTPADIAMSSQFVDVSADCVRLADESERHIRISFESFLDAKSAQSAHEEEIEIKRSVVAEIAPLLLEHGVEVSTYGEMLYAMVAAAQHGVDWYRDIDTPMAQSIKDSGLHDLIGKHVPPDWHGYFLDIAALRGGAYLSRDKMMLMLKNAERSLRDLNVVVSNVYLEVELKRAMWLKSDSEAIRMDLAATYQIFYHHIRTKGVMTAQVQALEWLLSLDYSPQQSNF